MSKSEKQTRAAILAVPTVVCALLGWGVGYLMDAPLMGAAIGTAIGFVLGMAFTFIISLIHVQ